MIRARGIALTILLTAAFALSVPALAQVSAKPNSSARGEAHKASRPNGPRVYTPRVIGRSDSFIIEGTVSGIKSGRITVKAAGGASYEMEVDEQTTFFESGELVSIATLPDIALNSSDLNIFDRVEVVAERAGRKSLARIITRIASASYRAAKN